MNRFNFQEIYSAIKNKNLPIVSVGSGSGIDEALIKRTYQCRLITVEPEKNQTDAYRHTKRVAKPDYEYVDDLIKSEKDIVGNCVVMLLYPLPDFSTYDILSIYKLKPVEVVIMYNSFGASGSELLHQFLKRINPDLSSAKMKSTFPETIIVPSNAYKLNTFGFNHNSADCLKLIRKGKDLSKYDAVKEKAFRVMCLASLLRENDFPTKEIDYDEKVERVCAGEMNIVYLFFRALSLGKMINS
jgi:hypothetical protein